MAFTFLLRGPAPAYDRVGERVRRLAARRFSEFGGVASYTREF